MIVECGNCQTRFQLDASRVPLRGIRVRCSSCKSAFFLPHPDAAESDVVDDVAEAAAREAARSPDSTHDLDSEPEADWSHESEPEPEEEESREFEEEEDWEFNDGPAEPDPESKPHSDSEDEAETGSSRGEDETSVVAVDGDSDSEENSSASEDSSWVAESDLQEAGAWTAGQEAVADSGDGDASDDADFDAGLELASDGLSLDLADEGVAAESASETGSDFGEASDFSAAPQEPDPSPAAPDSAGVEPGDSSLFSESGEDLRPDVQQSEELGSASSPAEAATATTNAGETEEAQAPSGKTDRSASAKGPGISRPTRASRAGRVLSEFERGGRALGWLATLSLLAFGVGWGLSRAPSMGAASPAVVEFGDLHVDRVEGHWLETARAGVLYTVTGRIVNDGRSARPLGGSLRVALTDRSGDRLEVPAAVAGIRLAPRSLRELPVWQLREAAREASTQLAWIELEPGASTDFFAYFVGIPDEARGFVLEMQPSASSGPGRAPVRRATIGEPLANAPRGSETTP